MSAKISTRGQEKTACPESSAIHEMTSSSKASSKSSSSKPGAKSSPVAPTQTKAAVEAPQQTLTSVANGAPSNSVAKPPNDADPKKNKKAEKQKSKQEKKSKQKKENKCTDGSANSSSNGNSKSKSDSTKNMNEPNLVNESGSVSDGVNNNKAKPLVEELKLFQNNNLLNQQDPMQKLHLQLNQFINSDIIKADPRNSNNDRLQAGQIKDSSGDIINQRTDIDLKGEPAHAYDVGLNFGSGSDTCSTIKKGVLWQQQSYEKFHQRLFNRWKKRYFLLTTDYLVCFKRSLPKVGRSEMGQFLYKTSLGDMLKVDWLKPNKSDKGCIILHLNGSFNLHLWTKNNLEDWMFMIKESIIRYQARRACITQNGTKISAYQDHQPLVLSGGADLDRPSDDLYENTGINLQKQQPENSSNSIDSSTQNGVIALTASAQRSQDDSSTEATASDRNGSLQPKERLSRLSKLPPAKKTSPPGSLECGGGKDNPAEKIPSSALDGDATPLEPPDKPVINDSAAHCTTDEAYNDRTKSVDQKTPESERRKHNQDPKDNRTIHSCEGPDGGKHSPPPNNASNDSSSRPPLDQASLTRKAQSTSRGCKDGSAMSESSDQTGAKSGSANRNQQRQSLLAEESEQQRHSLDAKIPTAGNVRELATTAESSHTNQSSTAGSVQHSEGKEPDSHRSKGESMAPAEASRRALGQTSNLIRRDDSWQSLVSLTRVGRPPTAMQVAQRSLYAQHIMPHSVDGSTGAAEGRPSAAGPVSDTGPGSFSGSSLVESTVTPIRTGPFRQHSIQSHSSRRKPSSSSSQRAFQAPGNHHASFDSPSTNLQQQQQLQPRAPVSVSYHQKLLQLQLLHNSNNVDYIRQGGNGPTTNDYQIYGPESTVYGYSSMRSNLKSAASEFSFIRPSSSSHIQSTLPHQNSAHVLNRATPLPNSQHHHRQQAAGAFGRSPSFRHYRHPLRDSNNNLIEDTMRQQQQQFLVDPNTGERVAVHHLLQPSQAADLVPPMRELPLKPNKKRFRDSEAAATAAANDGNNAAKSLPKSSSLTSSIACFFRRAFSRRSKKRGGKRRSKLTAESCSSSLGAFENENFPIVPSAFSTGSKSVDGRHTTSNRTNQQQQNQRMVDMIEAFTSKNFAEQANSNSFNQPTNPTGIVREIRATTDFLVDNNSANNINSVRAKQVSSSNQHQTTANVTPARLPGISQARTNAINQFVSPLHKSNSISATMGLSLIDNSALGKRASLMYDSELRALQQVGGSPVLPRSAKVLSANLTPLRDPMMNQYQHHHQHHHHHHRLSVLSPHNGGNHQVMPRPSSIYGQPSMTATASPLMMSQNEERNANFGSQRNSIHGFNIMSKAQPPASVAGELLRTQMMKANHLGTTQEEEVAEELPMPLRETRPNSHAAAAATIITNSELGGQYDNRPQIAIANGGHYMSRAEAFKVITSSPSNNSRPTPQHRRAIVNPILQSPTMDTIYDNHPMLFNGGQSHYDNYHHHNNGPAQDHQRKQARFEAQQSPMVRRAKPSNSMIQFHSSGESSQQPIMDGGHHSSERIVLSQSDTPSHQQQAGLFLSGSNKPAAIVAPSTSDHYVANSNNNSAHPRHSSRDRGSLIENGSPLVRQRNGPSYQQSPLLEQRANQRNVIYSTGQQSVAVNIAGAPGINLDPALAASLLAGTNIDAYESSTYSDYPSGGAHSSYTDSSKTFLVSTRLSKSMAANQQSSSSRSNTGESSSSSTHNTTANSIPFRQSSPPQDEAEELSSSTGSQSVHSSRSRSSSRANGSLCHNVVTSKSMGRRRQIGRDNQEGENQHVVGTGSSSMDSNHDTSSRVDHDTSSRVEDGKNSSADSSSSLGESSQASKRWGDSEQSDAAESLDGERNWITSKLAGRPR